MTRPLRRALWWAVPLGLLTALVHCGGDDDSISGDDRSGSGAYGNASGVGGTPGTGGAGTGGTPAEQEIEGGFEAPVLTGKYMWSANPESGRVAVVDAATLRVQTLDAGSGPTYLAAVPTAAEDDSAAIVLNVQSENATLLRLRGGEALDPLTFPTHRSANAWAIAPSGKWAVAWSDESALDKPDPMQSLQDLTLILVAPTTGEPRALRRVAGYRPKSVAFDALEENLIVVSEHGLTVIDLTNEAKPEERDLVDVTTDVTSDPTARDVSVTADGETALVRTEGSGVIDFVTVDTGAIDSVTLGSAVTDLDLAADGTFAVAVMRAIGQAAILEVPAAATDPAAIEVVDLGGAYGSVSLAADGSVGVFYTNGVPTPSVVTLSLAPETYLATRFEDVRAPVRAVFLAPDAAHAVALLDPPAESEKPGAFSVVTTIGRRAPLTQGSDAPAMAVALGAAEANHALVTVRDDTAGVYGVHVVALDTLQEDYLPLASPPLATGIIPSLHKGYVAQQHAAGRITFIDLPASLTDGTAATPTARTLTGFELAARVIYPEQGQ